MRKPRQVQPTRDKVETMLRDGWKVRDIAMALSVSTQAVYQHKDRLKADGTLDR